MTDVFDSKHIGLKVQKKLLGKMATQKVANVFIDDSAGRVLDNLYKVSKLYTGSKKTAEKLAKNLIKTFIKISILYRNDQFSDEELRLLDSFRGKLRSIAMTVVSFHQVDFTFDRHFLSGIVYECCMLVKQLVQRHLTDKSLDRVDFVFQFYGDVEFLDALFDKNGPYTDYLSTTVAALNEIMDEGSL